MIELLSLQFGNIRSFVDDQFISFENREKLIQIDGKNENTGGSSGAGKSTVVMALLYLLDLGDVPTTLLQSRVTKEGIWAIGKFLFDGIPVTVSRSKKDGLVIELPDEKISGNIKLAEEKLEQLIGIPKKIFKKMIHKKQKEGGFFLNMTPKEMYEFLISVLGLEKYIVDIQNIDLHSTAYVNQVNDLTRKNELDQSSLVDLERILTEKKRPELTVSDEEINSINNKILITRDSIDFLKKENKELIDEVPKPVENKPTEAVEALGLNRIIAEMAPARAEINNKLSLAAATQKNIEAALTKIPFAVADAQKAGAEINKIRNEKEHMEKSQCPTCLQNWVGDSIQQKIDKADSTIKSLIQEALRLKSIIDEKPHHEQLLALCVEDIKRFNDELSALQEQRSALDAQKFKLMEDIMRKNETSRNEYRLLIAEIENRNKALLDLGNEDLRRYEIQLSSLNSQKNSYLMSMSQYEKETISLTSLINKKKQEIEDSKKIINSASQKLLIASESKRMMKAYVLQTFQDTLDAIGEVATGILAGIPNVNTSTVYFEGCKETKSGTIKDEIVAILNTDGNNDVPIKSLSGGERTAIDLAVDLAVIDVIETKAAKGANFLFLDEPFDGLDSISKENCLEILKQLDTNKKIFMVDHSSELKEMVSDVILVVKSGETSTIAS